MKPTPTNPNITVVFYEATETREETAVVTVAFPEGRPHNITVDGPHHGRPATVSAAGLGALTADEADIYGEALRFAATVAETLQVSLIRQREADAYRERARGATAGSTSD